ncbi:MAG TPA: hypothetical protein VJO53_15180 [Candidatus Acidoferrales bacterium]|nr:hypothetical protein [Candidatus Acidoferrales bacterium]
MGHRLGDRRVSAQFPKTLIWGLALSMLAALFAYSENFLSRRAFAAAGGGAGAMDQGCDRACLDGIVNQYLVALVAHDPSQLYLNKGWKATETGQAVRLGEGMWKSVDQIGIYQLHFADPDAAEAGILALTDEHGVPGVLALRLKMHSRKISEVESIVVRQDIPGQGGNLTTSTMFAVNPLTPIDRKWFILPDPLFPDGVAHAQRTPRDRMIAAADAYFDGIERSSSAGVPIDGSCIRRDNGVQTTNNPGVSLIDPAFPSFKVFGLDCAAQLDSRFYSVISKVRARRYPIVDDERGIVFAIVLFDHPGDKLTVEVPGVGAVAVAPTYRVPSSYLVAAVFKILSGKIVRIELLERVVPYGMPSGWN